MSGKSPMRAGIDEHNAVAREDRAQCRDCGSGMNRLGRPLAILDVIESRAGFHLGDERLPLGRAF